MIMKFHATGSVANKRKPQKMWANTNTNLIFMLRSKPQAVISFWDVESWGVKSTSQQKFYI
jgi:hypothetical protein